MKVYVYAICKNESKFAKRWMESMSEADGVYVLDTGSEDDTVQVLREAGAVVEIQEFKPWRFDTARNRSLEMVPEDADVCVCTDLDELFHPGWRALVEAAWKPDTTRAAYRYTWNFNPDGSEGFVFWLNNMHERRGYRWTHPVHEVLERTDGLYTNQIYIEGIQLDHHADDTKPRSQYLPLLEMSVAECPNDDRNMHYLGREYYFYRRWEDAIRTLEHHLQMPRQILPAYFPLLPEPSPHVPHEQPPVSPAAKASRPKGPALYLHRRLFPLTECRHPVALQESFF